MRKKLEPLKAVKMKDGKVAVFPAKWKISELPFAPEICSVANYIHIEGADKLPVIVYFQKENRKEISPELHRAYFNRAAQCDEVVGAYATFQETLYKVWNENRDVEDIDEKTFYPFTFLNVQNFWDGSNGSVDTILYIIWDEALEENAFICQEEHLKELQKHFQITYEREAFGDWE